MPYGRFTERAGAVGGQAAEGGKTDPFASHRLIRSVWIVLVYPYEMLLSRDMEKNYGFFS